MSDSESPVFTPHHVGIVVADLESAMNAYMENFGYTFFQFQVNEKNASLSDGSLSFTLRIGMGQLGLNLVELIQPISGTTVYSEYLARNRPGLHHIGYSTLDLDAARKKFEARGYTCVQNGKINDLVDFSYYDAPDLGCVVEPLQFSFDLAGFLLKNAQIYTRELTKA